MVLTELIDIIVMCIFFVNNSISLLLKLFLLHYSICTNEYDAITSECDCKYPLHIREEEKEPLPRDHDPAV